MRLLLITMATGLFSYGQPLQNKKRVAITQEKVDKKKISLPTVGVKINGNFTGYGKNEFAIAKRIKIGQGNPVENGTPDEYEIQFSGNKMKSINAGCCDILLINEGDLNNDGADDISVYQAPMNGCTYSMTTYSFINKNWKQIVQTFLIPTGCENISNDNLQKRIFKQNKVIYYYATDPNDKHGKLVRKKANLK